MRARHFADLIGRSSFTDPRWQIGLDIEGWIENEHPSIDPADRREKSAIRRDPFFLRNQPIYLSGSIGKRTGIWASYNTCRKLMSYRYAKFHG